MYSQRVSICTPTFNRRPFLPHLIRAIEQQTYPTSLLEWIVLDDGTDCVRDLFASVPETGIQIRYEYSERPLSIGEKRNRLNALATGDILVYMDDDDYYPPTRVQHAVDQLNLHPDKLIAGSSAMLVYIHSQQQLYQCGPYAPHHITAATMAFRKELLQHTQFLNTDWYAEEKHFLKQYTLPVVPLDFTQTIVVMSHRFNTIPKEKLLECPEKTRTFPSSCSLEQLIPDSQLRTWYIHQLPLALQQYSLGGLHHKPTELIAAVLRQTQRINQSFARV